MDDRIARFIEKSENKYWGKYRGLVDDRNDPEQIGRLKIQVPSLFGSAITGWAYPVAPYAGPDLGMFFIPQVGDLVWVEFAEGELEHPLWTGCGWTKPGGQSEIPKEAQQSYPDQQVIKTKSGNTIILSDAAGSEMITIRAKSGCEIVIDPNADKVTVQAGSVIIQSTDGNIEMDAGSHEITLKGASINIQSTDGNIGMNAGSDDITLSAANVAVSGSMDVS